MLYELLASARPFEGDAPTVVMMKIVNEEAQPIGKFVPDLPPALVAAVMSALNKEPSRRFPHAGDFGAELRLMRLAVERGSETLAGETADLAQTTFVSGSAGGGSDTAAQAVIGSPVDQAGTPRARALLRERCVVPGSRMSTWIAVAAAALAAIAVAVALTGRDSGTDRDGALRTGASRRGDETASTARPILPLPSSGSSSCRIQREPEFSWTGKRRV